MQKNKLLQVIKREARHIHFFNYPGRVLYISGSFRWLAEALLEKYGAVHPYSMVYFLPGFVHAELTLDQGTGPLVMNKLQDKQWLRWYRKKISEQPRRWERWKKQHPAVGGLPELCEHVREAGDLLIEMNLYYHLSTGVDRYFEEKIQEIGFPLTAEERTLLTVSRKPSVLMRHDDLALRLKGKLPAYQRLTLRQKASLKRCYQAGYFLHAGYGGVRLWILEDEYRFIQQSSRQQLEKQQQQRQADRKAFHRLKSRLPAALRHWLSIFQYFSQVRDERKSMQQKVFYCQAECLERISSLTGIPRPDLEYLSWKEFTPELLQDNDQLKRIIDERKRGYLWIWSRETRHLFWTGKAARQAYQKYSVQARQRLKGIRQLSGQCACPGVASGYVRVVRNALQIKDYKSGSILVTGMTSPDFVPLMKKSAAIITELGGITCHAAIVARELGKPCILGTRIAMRVLRDGDLVEVDADKGVVKIIKRK
ncbi:MAG TPA: PEP-utilizing enzyme [Candidatus Nanoarchaeia archaeon]|nr:PEP-utilizing enzyme [Candidatus Nanoarchaeia archaeon]